MIVVMIIAVVVVMIGRVPVAVIGVVPVVFVADLGVTVIAVPVFVLSAVAVPEEATAESDGEDGDERCDLEHAAS